MGATLVALAAVLGVLAACAPFALATSATGSISGTVTDKSTTDPIEGVLVCAFQPGSEEEEEEWNGVCAETGAGGEYQIAHLEAGEYEVEYRPGGLNYVRQFYDGKQHRSEADAVVVGTGPVSGVDAELEPGAEITGTVRAEVGGAPVRWVEVCAWSLPDEYLGGCAYTNSSGSYTVLGLAPGEYGVEFWPESDEDLLRQVYDHRDRWSEADPVPVTAGAVTANIDADLKPGAEVAGTIYSAQTGAPLREIVVCSVEVATGELWNCTWSNSAGRYLLPGISPGAYKIAFSLEWSEFLFGFEDEPDGYPTQFYNGQSTLGAANVLNLVGGQVTSGIDAHLGTPPLPAPTTTVTPTVTPAVTPNPHKHRKKRRHCRRGFRSKKVKGKVRCVKVHHHHRRHTRGGHAAATASLVPPSVPRAAEIQRLFER